MFFWTEQTQDIFETLKSRLLSTPTMTFLRLQQSSILYTNASKFAKGTALTQVQNGMERAICYVAKELLNLQTSYSITRREILAVVSSARNFRHYLLGRMFTIVNNHRIFQKLDIFKDPERITTRWFEKLASFDLPETICHRPWTSIGPWMSSSFPWSECCGT